MPNSKDTSRPGQALATGSKRSMRTREEIYVAAIELFTLHGVAKVSMQDIADRAQTARSTVFKHYAQKIHLLSEFYTRLGNEVLAEVSGRSPKTMQAGMRQFFKATQAAALRVEPLLREVVPMTTGRGPLVEEEASVDQLMAAHLVTLLEIGVKTGEIRPEIDIHGAASLILCALTDINQNAIQSGNLSKLASLSQKRLNLLVQGLG